MLPDARFTASLGEAGWRLYEVDATSSTNDLARTLPSWSAVRADTQSGGRGRLARRFVSDAGGLWISAVLPAPPPATQWIGFSLMVGWHLVGMLRARGLANARLRWPNDLMLGPLKLAGLLIEQNPQGTLVVGLGLNVTNAPWEHDPALRSIATHWAAHASPPPLSDLTLWTLDALASAHADHSAHGMSHAIRQLNGHWQTPVPVEIFRMGGGSTTGLFAGLDMEGHLRLLDVDGREFLVEHQSVEKMVEKY